MKLLVKRADKYHECSECLRQIKPGALFLAPKGAEATPRICQRCRLEAK